jgi:replicative DNA helicase
MSTPVSRNGTDSLPREPSVNGQTHTREFEPLRLLPLRHLLDEWQSDAEAAHLAYATGTPRGPITGHKTLDRELGGAMAPGVHVLHAGPGIGKTAFALQIAATSPFPSVYVTAEMRPLELLRRVTARATGTYLGRLKSGELEAAESLALARRAAATASHLVFADATQAWAASEWIEDVTRVVKGDARHVLVVVDSVHSWAEGMPGDVDEYLALGEGLRALRRVAQVLECPVLAIAERNRAGMKEGGLSASAGSRKFEYGGESVLSLSREKENNADATGEVSVTLTIEKNRNGAPGKKIRMLFNGALQRFTEADW